VNIWYGPLQNFRCPRKSTTSPQAPWQAGT